MTGPLDGSPTAAGEVGSPCAPALASGDTARAAAWYRRVMAAAPDRGEAALTVAACGRSGPDLVVRIAGLLKDEGAWDEARVCLEMALAAAPSHAAAWCNLGLIHKRRGDDRAAETAYRRALAIRPDFPEALSNLGVVLTERGQTGEAMARCREALDLSPGFASAMNNLARAMKYSGRAAESLAWYEKACASSPEDPVINANALYALAYDHRITPAAAAAAHRRWGRILESAVATLPPPAGRAPDPDRPLTVGYLSPDFRRHPVTRFLLPILGSHDRRRFRIACFSAAGRGDAVTGRVRALCDEWHDVSALGDAAAARKVAGAGVDVLVDLAGHTAGNRLGVFCARPAPVQVSYLGYPQTTGLTRMDARITDALADPPGPGEALYTEALMRLPGGFLCYGAPDEAPPPAAADPGRPLTFGSFNNLAKVNPAVLDAWAAVLRAVPESRLLIKFKSLGDPAIREDLYRRLTARGIGRHRVDLVGHLPDPAEHFGLYRRVDVALDTFPYNGTTTTCEALWMGVPVVALAGAAHAGRVGVSILTAVGLAGLIAADVAGYVATAAHLAGDDRARAVLRQGLRRRMLASPLMDAAAVTGGIEAAYRHLWRRWCRRGGGRP